MAQLYDSLHDKGETEEDVRLHILTDFGHGVDQSAADAWTTEVLHQIEILGVVYHTVDDADRQKAIRYQIILGCVRRAMEDQLHKQGK